jgi:adenylosuccinate lyase
MTQAQVFDNPLVTRYASREMAELWGAQRKFGTWRRLWLALAEAEAEMGLLADDGVTPRIRPAQLAALQAHLDDIDFDRAAAHERRLRHDVMAHIHALGDVCPEARDIIHLGATSCYVTDNTDLLLLREGLGLLRDRLVGAIDAVARFALQWKDLPTLGYTHYQPAQLVTVGKRASLWGHDLVMDLQEFEHRRGTIHFRSIKGTTGTQASFLTLFRGDHEKVRQLERLVAAKMGFDTVYPVTGQTYSRKLDSQILATLSGLFQSAHKMGTDLRLLAHDQEVQEPVESEQVGSSAMPYKSNPMRAERLCGLARFGMALGVSADQTAAVQWLERTLDDSVNRRLTLPQAFLTADAVLRLLLNIANGLVVHPEVVRRNVEAALPYMATESVLMRAVAQGGDRQKVHEAIRRHSRAASDRMKAGGSGNDLFERLEADPLFAGINWTEARALGAYVGRAPEQVEEWVRDVIEPIRRKYHGLLGQRAQVEV